MSRKANTHKHSHIYTNTSTHMQKSHIYKHICTFPHEQIYMHKCILIHDTYMYMQNKYSYRHMSTCIYPHLHICTQITYIHIHAFFHTYFCIHRPIHTFPCTYIYMYINTLMYSCIHTQTCTPTYIYAHIYTHTSEGYRLTRQRIVRIKMTIKM